MFPLRITSTTTRSLIKIASNYKHIYPKNITQNVSFQIHTKPRVSCKYQDQEANSNESNSNDSFTEELLQQKILDSSLSFVNSYGWTDDALWKGAEHIGYSGAAHGLFEKGAVDLVNYYYHRCQTELESKLKETVEQNNKEGVKISSIDLIGKAIEMRLRMNIEYMDSLHQVLVLHASPSNVLTAIHNARTLMDTIMYYSGDKSHNVDWYSKRMMLAAVYKSTELCMLQDKSEDFKDTWEFLDRRLKEASTFEKCTTTTESILKGSSLFGQIAFTTIQNMLGLSRQK